MSENKTKRKILVVDDSPEDTQLYRRILSHDSEVDYDIVAVADGEDGLEQYRSNRPDCILLDYNLPDMDGIEFVHELAKLVLPEELSIVMLTGQGNEAVAVEAMKSGVRDYLIKGAITPSALRRSVRNVIEKVSLEQKNQHLTEQLVAANSDLEKNNKKLRELTDTAHRFVDNVAHDIRTPLTVIKEFASIIAEGLGGPVTDQQTEYLQFITSAVSDLAQMVDDFLDSSKLKAQVLRVDRQPHKVEDLIQAVRTILTTRAATKNIQLIEELQPNLPLVLVDAEKIERVIVNLAVNAIKFSPEGSNIRIWTKIGPEGDVEIGITDQGPGLTELDRKIIFERFKQVGDMQRASTKGFGLGLNIARELVWLNLGSISVQSHHGEGSTFSFTLPPCDSAILIHRYFERLEELDEPPIQMAVLQISADAALESIRRTVAAGVYPMDLILSVVEQNSVFAIGSTTQSDRWVEALQNVCSQTEAKEGGQNGSPYTIRCIKEFPFAQWNEVRPLSALLQDPRRRSCA